MRVEPTAQILRGTPEMEARISDRVWSLEESPIGQE